MIRNSGLVKSGHRVTTLKEIMVCEGRVLTGPLRNGGRVSPPDIWVVLPSRPFTASASLNFSGVRKSHQRYDLLF